MATSSPNYNKITHSLETSTMMLTWIRIQTRIRWVEIFFTWLSCLRRFSTIEQLPRMAHECLWYRSNWLSQCFPPILLSPINEPEHNLQDFIIIFRVRQWCHHGGYEGPEPHFFGVGDANEVRCSTHSLFLEYDVNDNKLPPWSCFWLWR